MNREELINQIQKKKSFLCVGLDTDIKKIPQHLLKYEDPIYEFNRRIIDATSDYCVAYKPNLAFYEAYGPKGLESLEKTVEHMPEDMFTIADAKRGDIGNTSDLYARAFFKHMAFDSVTVAPYMGEDSVKPFLNYEEKWVILLALTSNPGSKDFQDLTVGMDSEKLYETVLKTSRQWGSIENLMYVVGATKAEELIGIRKIVPDHFLLVPGVGAQGGSLEDVAKYGMNRDCGLLVNSSRGIIYASKERDFALKAKSEAEKLQLEMAEYLDIYK
ncbi:MAG: orotidine-5'-phosphate decarboxylase [Cytophagales bacterium]|nr:orotidine-5'-phosphate decarboxylase [Cytophagales bacterium]